MLLCDVIMCGGEFSGMAPEALSDLGKDVASAPKFILDRNLSFAADQLGRQLSNDKVARILSRIVARRRCLRAHRPLARRETRSELAPAAY
jgi:hypothetical protein